jgi:DsbC/DsbD-like thiol-disulfide interchange protein
MIATTIRRLAASAAALSVAVAATAAVGADASPWDGDQRFGMRLVAGDPRINTPDGGLRAGVEIRLAKGWKTYWRYPGDSGVPPRLDFAGSSNVKSVAVLWPAPHRFADASGFSIGYTDNVIFPLHVMPADRASPVVLRLKLDYAACEKLCVPAEGAAELKLPVPSSSQEARLAAAEASVPKVVGLNEGKGFAIRSMEREGDRRVIVDITAPEHFAVDLFAEGPAPDWALPLPKPVADAPAGIRRFSFDLEGLPPGARADGAVLTLTAVAGGSAIEIKARLD